MDPKVLYASAGELAAKPMCKRLALLSAGVTATVNVFLLLLEILIDRMMTDAVGLAALGTRAALMTVQGVLQLAVTLALPFWTYGFYQVAMEIARKNEPSYSTLFAGFRRFGPLLRLLLLESFIATGLTLLGSWISTMLYMMTPFAARINQYITPVLVEAESVTDSVALTALMEPVMQEMLKDLWPLYLLMAATLAVLLIPWFYKLRLAPYHILDGQDSALVAMSLSKYEMYGNRFTMFKLDLRCWLYYGLMVLSAFPLYLYTGSSKAIIWGLALISYGLSFVFQWLLLPRVQTAYALAYDALTHKDKTDVPEGETHPEF